MGSRSPLKVTFKGRDYAREYEIDGNTTARVLWRTQQKPCPWKRTTEPCMAPA